MAKTDAERQRICRAKLKLDTESYKSYKEKDKERKRIQRNVSKFKASSSNEAARKKRLNRERVRKFRQKKKENQSYSSQENDLSQAYETPQALGKALGKVSKVLPKSPRKRKAVVFKLANSSGFVVGKKTCTGNRGIDEQTVKHVKDFYNLDSISRQAPGRKDFVTIRQLNNKKQQIQKRYLL